MKQISFIISTFLLLVLPELKAQNEIDALRYSQLNPIGTTKSLSMAGAMGAVGGDFTSLSINPAGIGFYRASEFTISPSLYWNKTSSVFLGESYQDDTYKFNMGNLGFILNKSTGNESGWISTSIGFGYNRIANLNQDIFMRGTNTQNSYLDNFTWFANNYPNNLDPFYEQLAVDVYLLPLDTTLNEYFNDIENGGYGQIQQRLVSSRGNIGEYVFSIGGNYSNKLYMGATLGINRVNFEQTVTHSEYDPADLFDFFEGFDFEEYLTTQGTGYSLKFGLIGRPSNFIRFGAAFHLPTFYYLTDFYENSMTGYYDAEENMQPETASTGLYEYRYRLRTPFKLIGSTALTLGKMGMISVDYEFLDYRNANLEASGESFFEENNTIDNLYRSVSNIKIGGELKLGDFYLRGGYAFYQSPFATGEPNVDSNRNVFSGGIGLKSKYFFIDAGYSYYTEEMSYYMYVPQMVDGSRNTSYGNTAQLTMGFRF